MPKKRLSHPRRSSSSSVEVVSASSMSKASHENKIRFAGVSLGGGKSNRTCIAIIEYYPEHRKAFLTHLYEKIQTHEEISSDLQVHEILTEIEKDLQLIAFDAPLKFPHCVECKLKCPGYEKCKEPEILWMWNWARKRNKEKKPRKIFTPYTQRCVELYLQNELEESFLINEALGSNAAPLTVRAHFINRRLKASVIEVVPKISLWRIGRTLKLAKSHLRFHKHMVGGDESRKVFLEALTAKNLAFIYHQDLKTLVENISAFDAFLCAFTACLKFRGLTEKRPDHFPKSESWIEIPVIDFN